MVYLHARCDFNEFAMLANVCWKPILGAFLEELLHLLAVKCRLLVFLFFLFKLVLFFFLDHKFNLARRLKGQRHAELGLVLLAVEYFIYRFY
jgi:hypothetical protein